MPRTAPSAVRAVHPIQVVARRTGLSIDVIRAWERRYRVVEPVRTGSGRRLYTDADVERLRALARATLTGRTIGQVATLTDRELAALLEDPAAARDASGASQERPHRSAAASASSVDHLGVALETVARFDGVALDAALRRAAVALPAAGFLDDIVVPLWARVTDATRDGTMRPPLQHLTLTILRRTLHRLAEVAMTPLAAPDLVVTTPMGQSQELGALLVAAAAGAEGWRVTYVGPGLPPDEIAETASYAGARAVAVSLGAAAGDRVIPRDLRRLRALLPRDVPILVEGAAAESRGGVLREIDATVVRDLPALRGRLRALRGD